MFRSNSCEYKNRRINFHSNVLLYWPLLKIYKTGCCKGQYYNKQNNYRKYFFYNVQQLKERILELDGQATVTGKNKDALFGLVVNTERSRVRRNTLLENNEEPNDDEIDPVLLDIFKASKMKPLGEEAKKYCRAGHLLERPFLEQFHQHSVQGLTLCYMSIAIHETPVGMLS